MASGMKDEQPSLTSELPTLMRHPTEIANRLRICLLKSVKNGTCTDPLATNAGGTSLPFTGRHLHWRICIDGPTRTTGFDIETQLTRKLLRKRNKPTLKYSDLLELVWASPLSGRLVCFSAIREIEHLGDFPHIGKRVQDSPPTKRFLKRTAKLNYVLKLEKKTVKKRSNVKFAFRF